MYNQPTPFQNFWFNTSPLQKLAIFLIPIAVIIIIVIFVVSSSNTQPPQNPDSNHIIIENFSATAPNIPEFYQKETQSNIWQILNQFNDVSSNTYASGEIRSGSYEQSPSDDNSYTSSFLVDIPSLKQSFSVSFGWYNTNNPEEYNIVVECPYYTDVIYKETYCNISSQPFDNLYKYLPSTINDSEYSNIDLSAATYSQFYAENTGEPYLSVDFSSCDDDANIAPLEKIVNNWLNTRFIHPSEINIEYYPYCPVQGDIE